MGAKLDLNSIQCINLFYRITGVRTKNCFEYNNKTIFVVDKHFLQRALGENSQNVHRLSLMLRKRVKVIPYSNMENFVRLVVQPIRFKRILIESDGQVVINAGMQAKASLIGRDKVKLNQLAEILKQNFQVKSVKVV